MTLTRDPRSPAQVNIQLPPTCGSAKVAVHNRAHACRAVLTTHAVNLAVAAFCMLAQPVSEHYCVFLVFAFASGLATRETLSRAR